mgnify:CR=1 FL=1
MSGSNFRGGRKPFPKPSAFESEIHPPHKTPFCTPGISPLQGANLHRRKFTVRKSRTVFIHAARRTGRMDAVTANGYIFGQIRSNIYGTSLKSLPAAVRKRQP